jgi:uncharacterized membrane protein YagU involved in acid resistance
MRTTRAVAAGMVGTAAMTALLLIEPSVGLPKIAMGQIVSTSLGLASASLTIGPILGWVIHFVVGIALAVVYAALFISRLPGSALVRGLLYGTLVFLVAQLVFMPLAGIGVFSRGDLELIAGSLLGHLVYGGLTGWIYGDHPTAS